jgi:glycosyltransferase involved in cell wall biosynthesis
LRIGIDLTGIWRPSTGIFVYAKELARELLLLDEENKYTLFFSGEVHPEFRELEGRFRAVEIPVREEIICKQLLMATLCNASGLDLIHFPALPPPVACLRPFIWTLHDATPWLYPDTMDLKGRLYFQWVGAWAARLSRSIITVSHEARRDITRALRIAESKVRVVYEGVDGAFRKVGDHALLDSVRLRYGLPERFILSVGTLEPRKNLPALIQAYRRMRKANQTKLGLVIAGRTGWKSEGVQDHLGSEADRVVVTGFVPQRELVALYNLAEIFVLPSLYEGFGFPPLEAMACGCPVIVSNRGSLPEVVGDAALLIDPESEDSIVAAILRMECSQSLRAHLVRRGLERVKSFSWKTTAAKTLDLYREVGDQVRAM